MGRIGFLFLAAISVTIIKAQTQAQKDEATIMAYKDRAPTDPQWFELARTYPCTEESIVDARKFIAEGKNFTDSNQLKDQNVYVIVGTKDDDKTLLANMFEGIDPDAKPEHNLNRYPRVVGKKNAAIILEAANMGGDSAADHIAGIYTLNKMLEHSKGIALIMAHRAKGRLQAWYYFSRICETNPEIGWYRISPAESMTLTKQDDYYDIDYVQGTLRFKNSRFGRNPAILFKRDEIDKQLERVKKYLVQTYRKNQFVPGIKFPLLAKYEICLKEKLPTFIVNAIVNASNPIKKHFQDIASNKGMKENEKFSKFEDGFNRMTAIADSISDNMTVDAMTNELAKYASELKLDKGAKDIKEIANYAKLLNTFQRTYNTKAWLDGITVLKRYLKEEMNNFELKISDEDVVFDCKDAAKVNHMLYELQFELEAKPNETMPTLDAFFEKYERSLGGLAQVYRSVVEENQDINKVKKVILDKLKSYNDSACVIPVDEESKGSCDESAVQNVLELLSKGSFDESNTVDNVILVMGTHNSKTIEVANVLSSFKVDSPRTKDALLYTEYLTKPVNSTYSVVVAPNFSKDKSLPKSLTANYFTYKSIQSADAAKLIITVDQKALESAEFGEIIENSAKVALGAGNVTRCIGFVVTGVELGDGEKMADKAQTVAGKLVNQLEKNSKNEKASNITKSLLSILLSKKEQISKQVGILINSQKLSNPESFSKNRQHLLDVVNKNLLFISFNTKNFINQLNDKEKELAYCAGQKTKERITKNIEEMVSEVIQVYKTLENDAGGDYTEVFKRFDQASKTVSMIRFNTTESSTVVDSLALIDNFLAELEINIASDTLDATEIDIGFVNSLGKSNIKSLMDGFTTLISYIEKTRRWYYFLGKLETWLSEYDVIKNMDKYESKGKTLLAAIRQSTAERKDVVSFIDSIQELPKEPLKKLMGDKEPSLLKLSYLGYMMDRMFRNKMSVDCSEEVNVCQGTYLTLSSCMENLCLPDKSIEIHAANIVYIDIDVQKNGTSLAIFSPEWHITGNYKINLDGSPAQRDGPEKAKNGGGASVPGKAGKPGLPGGPAGSFYGIGAKFVKRGSLTITATGGKGGPGQEGGDGGPGKKPELPDFCDGCEKLTTTDFARQGFQFTKYCSNQFCYFYLGKYGERAAKGGDGGAPGIGGLSGSVNIVSTENQPIDFTIVYGPGPEGDKGKGGSSGRNILLEVRMSIETVSRTFYDDRYKTTYAGKPKFTEMHMDNVHGTPGSNAEGRKSPEGPIQPPAFPISINRYKFILREIFSRDTKNIVPVKFYREIETNQAVNRIYDTTSFADDFQRLEKQRAKLKKKMKVGPYFEFFLPRLANFSETGNHTEEVKKTVAYLYTVVLSTLSADRSREGIIVIDLPGYLNLISAQISKLKAFENDKIVNSYKNDYENNVMKSIKECQDLINIEIMPIVDGYKEQMTTQIDNLSKEVVELKKKAQIQKEALKKKSEKLQKTMMWRKAMAVVGGAVSLMSFMGPTAAAVGSAINAGARIAESIVLSEGGDPTAALATIPSAVNQQLTTIIQLVENKKSRMSDQLTEIEGRLAQIGPKTDKDVKDIKSIIQNNRKDLDKMDPKKLDPNALKNINKMQADLNANLAQKKLAMSKFQANDDKQDKKIQAIGYMQAIVNTGDMIARDVAKIRATDAQIEEVNNQLRENGETIRKLDRYEENIHAQMMPMVNNIMEKVDSLSEDNKGKSHAALDVAQWKTSEYFADIRKTLSKMMTGFSASEELENVMNKVDRGMATMMKVFHRIQDNQDKRDLAVFIADINSNKASEINVKDRFLNELLATIQTSIQRHLILENFERAQNAFTQAYFPFGRQLLEEYDIPKNFQVEDSTELTVTFAIQRINEMKSKIEITVTSITLFDEYLYNEYPFDEGESEITPPFYTWKYEDHRNAINSILKGESIELNADILKIDETNADRYAIKYNSLRLIFLTRDEDVQPKLNKVLDNFFVKLTTLGSNYYACNGKIFEISNDAFTIRVTHKLGKDGVEPVGKNDVYKKIRSNSAMFSPYGKWNVTLDGKGTKKLVPFLDTPLDMQLVGEGFYVDSDSDICETGLHLLYSQIQ